jgi:hypothetical protein
LRKKTDNYLFDDEVYCHSMSRHIHCSISHVMHLPLFQGVADLTTRFGSHPKDADHMYYSLMNVPCTTRNMHHIKYVLKILREVVNWQGNPAETHPFMFIRAHDQPIEFHDFRSDASSHSAGTKEGGGAADDGSKKKKHASTSMSQDTSPRGIALRTGKVEGAEGDDGFRAPSPPPEGDGAAPSPPPGAAPSPPPEGDDGAVPSPPLDDGAGGGEANYYPRPRGRAPKGCEWCFSSGKWLL